VSAGWALRHSPKLPAKLLQLVRNRSIFMGHARRYYAGYTNSCILAVSYLAKLKVGEHGLPLMGCGDWNDGLVRVTWRPLQASEK
jgi:hypothetical protein